MRGLAESDDWYNSAVITKIEFAVCKYHYDIE